MNDRAKRWLAIARSKLPSREKAPEHHERRTSLRGVLDTRTIDHTAATAKPKRRKGTE